MMGRFENTPGEKRGNTSILSKSHWGGRAPCRRNGPPLPNNTSAPSVIGILAEYQRHLCLSFFSHTKSYSKRFQKIQLRNIRSQNCSMKEVLYMHQLYWHAKTALDLKVWGRSFVLFQFCAVNFCFTCWIFWASAC